jgi:hypothetical protein
MDTKHIHYTHPHSPLYPPLEKTCFSLLPFIFFLKCLSVVQGGLALELRACVHALIELNPPPPLLTHSHAPLIFNSLQYRRALLLIILFIYF